MELTLKIVVQLAAIFLTGLSAGLFYAWEVSVIPGTKKTADKTYLQTMQQINRAILNPWFFVIFLGSLILLIISAIQHFQSGGVFWLWLAAAIIYFLGTFGVTALGNIPLNNQLDALELDGMDPEKMAGFRQHYEHNWNRLHTIRTVCSVISFLLSLISAFV